jgi:hypothetical protein
MTCVPCTQLLALAAIVVAVATAPSCGGEPDAAEAGRDAVTIDIDLEHAQRWTASGSPVERAMLCAGGARHLLDGIDPATNTSMPYRQRYRILEEAITERNSTEIVWIVENTCADGSGSFITREHWGPDVWSVESGTGAYSELAGGGMLSFTPVDYAQFSPWRLQLDGELSG